MVFRAKGRRFYDAKVPTKNGDWVKRPVGTMDRVVANAIEDILKVLGPKRKQAWDVLERVTSSPPSLKLSELYTMWNATPVTRHDKKTGKGIEPSPDERLAYVREVLNSVDVEPLITEWRDVLVGPAIHVKPDTADHYVSAVRSLIPEGQPFSREQLSEQRIRVWLEEMDDVTPATARKRAIGLHQFVTWLKSRGHLTHDPMLEIELPEAGDPLCHYLDTPDVVRLGDASAGQMRHFEYVLPGTALEVSTALAVRVRQVSTLDKEIHAPGTKAYNRNRVVRVAEFAWDAVLELVRGKHPDSLLFDRIPHRYAAGDSHLALVKTLGEEGHRIFVEYDGKAHNYTLRDHRHTWAVRAARSGWPIGAIAEVLGHANSVLANKVYAKFLTLKEERNRWEGKSHERDQLNAAERKRIVEGE
jgi:integrase